MCQTLFLAFYMICLIGFSVLFTPTVNLTLHTAKNARAQRGGVAELGLEPTWTSCKVGVGKRRTVEQSPLRALFLSIKNDWITATPVIYRSFEAAFLLRWAELSRSSGNRTVHQPVLCALWSLLEKVCTPAPEHGSSATVLSSPSLCSAFWFLFLNLSIHLRTASCQFSLPSVSNMSLPLVLTASAFLQDPVNFGLSS